MRVLSIYTYCIYILAQDTALGLPHYMRVSPQVRVRVRVRDRDRVRLKLRLSFRLRVRAPAALHEGLAAGRAPRHERGRRGDPARDRRAR